MIMIVSYALHLTLALSSVVNYDHKWCHNLEHHLQTFIVQATGKLVCLASWHSIHFAEHCHEKYCSTKYCCWLLGNRNKYAKNFMPIFYILTKNLVRDKDLFFGRQWCKCTKFISPKSVDFYWSTISDSFLNDTSSFGWMSIGQMSFSQHVIVM